MELDGRRPSLSSLSSSFEQSKKDSSTQKQLERLNAVQKLFHELQIKSEKRKDECVSAYKKFVVNFEDWQTKVLNRLQSGELLTTDILVFEEHLMVSLLQLF